MADMTEDIMPILEEETYVYEERMQEEKKYTVENQIAVLRDYWPHLCIGSRVAVLAMRMLTYGSREIIAIPKWKSIANTYSDALEKEIFRALVVSRNGAFYYGSRFWYLGAHYLRQYEYTARAFERMEREQDGDILIFQAQFGEHHTARSSVMSRKVYRLNEFGLHTLAVAAALLTHSSYLVSCDDKWIDCPGDEYRTQFGKEFNHVPCFFSHGRKLQFSTFPHDIDDTQCGSATGFQDEEIYSRSSI